MSEDKVYDVPADWRKRAYVERRQIPGNVCALDQGPERILGRAGQAHRLDQAVHQGQEHLLRPGNVSIKWFEDGTLNVCITASTAIWPSAAIRPPSSGKATIPKDDKTNHLQAAACRSLQVRQCAESARRQERRSRHYLYADDPRGGIRHARLCAHRRHSLGGVRRLLARFSRRPHRGLQVDVIVTADEGLRGGRKVPLKANVDAACDKAGGVGSVIVVRRTDAPVNMKSGRDVYYDEIAKTVPADCPCVEMSAEDPLFILYTSGSTGKPKGVLHTSAGYLRLHVDHASIRVRLSRRRYLLVHRRRRLGYRSQLHHLWPAIQWRHFVDVRRRAELSDHLALLGSVRQAQGQHLLHCAHRDPRPDAGRRRSSEENLA